MGIFDIIGTIAFAISGALLALEKSMDVFGVAVLALTTAVGGGIIRDLLLGINPPLALSSPWYSFGSLCVGVIIFVLAYNNIFFHAHGKRAEQVLLVMDAVGLAAFTITGIAVAETVSYSNWFLSLFVGVVTGVGGGILRDMFAGDIPSIFVKDFYAAASIIGGTVCLAGWKHLEGWQCMLLGAVTTFVLRMLAVRSNWHLPKVDRKDDK